MAEVSLLLIDKKRGSLAAPLLFRTVENELLMHRNPLQEVIGIGHIHQAERRAIRRYLNREGKPASHAASEASGSTAIGRDRSDRESVARRGDIPATHRMRFRCSGSHSGSIQGEVGLGGSYAASTLPVKRYLPRTGQVSLVDRACG